jgi:hypothetical protein
VPAGQHDDLRAAVVFGCEASDRDRLADLQWRSRAAGRAGRLERELQVTLEVVIPAQRALVRTVRIDDDLVDDARFAAPVFAARAG